MNDLRNIIGLIVVTQMKVMKDGKLDVYALVRKGEIERGSLRHRSAALDTAGPTDEEIKKGDYTKFPYERYHGDPKALFGSAKIVPVLVGQEAGQEGRSASSLSARAPSSAIDEKRFQSLLKLIKKPEPGKAK